MSIRRPAGPRLLALAGACILAGACARPLVMTDRGPQAHYQTGYPVHDTSREIERIFRSVMRVQVTGYYDTYRFAQEDAVTEDDIRQRATFARAVERFSFDHSKAGTATVVSRRGHRLSLITNEHVTRLPDTVVVYYDTRPADAGRPRHVESVSVRTGQTNVVIGLPELGVFRVVARDSAADIALIAVDIRDADAVASVQVLRIPAGDPSRLAWASFVYVLGYPRGFRMVTRGLVSDPNRGSDNAFLLDGLFNRGISGGLVLAVRGDTGRLEWVGMATAASAHTEFILAPERGTDRETGMLMPYDGRLFMEQVTRIDYGITFSVSMTAIRRFLQSTGYWSDLLPAQ
ncbi:MAG TPA: serine protease [Longimicrobiales bacterium]|nr:serine protease [Longimicrobiales bacterium]